MKKKFKIPTFCAHFSNLIFSWYRTLRSKIPCAMTTIFPKDFIHTQQHNFWTHFFSAYEWWNLYHRVEHKKCGILICNMSYRKFCKPEKSGKTHFAAARRHTPHTHAASGVKFSDLFFLKKYNFTILESKHEEVWWFFKKKYNSTILVSKMERFGDFFIKRIILLF